MRNDSSVLEIIFLDGEILWTPASSRWTQKPALRMHAMCVNRLVLLRLPLNNNWFQVLLSEDILCLAVKSPETADSSSSAYVGLFDVRLVSCKLLRIVKLC
jgi:hypothetical protein